MIRLLVVLMVATLLTGCKSGAEKKAEWVKFCEQGEFSLKQCEVLYSMKKAGDDAEESAAASSMMSGMAVGLSAGAAGRR